MKEIIFFTGAGLSAESGISTFRGGDGLWDNHSIEDVCNEFTWKKNFELVHQFYGNLRSKLKEVEPNEAHKTIRRIQERYPDRVTIITQNVDDLLEQAGCTDVLHLHGFLPEMRCDDCGYTWNVGYEPFQYGVEHCSKCQKRGQENAYFHSDPRSIKPHVVFFGGSDHKYHRMMEVWERVFQNPEAIFVVVGTDGSVVPIDRILSSCVGRKILCNLHKSEYIHEDKYEVFREPATQSLPKVEKIIQDFMKGD